MTTELVSDNAATTLTSSPTTGASTFTVASSTGFPAAVTGTSQFRVIIGTEIITVTNVSGTTWTCVATSAAHTSGDVVTHILTAAGLGNFVDGKVAASVPLTQKGAASGVATLDAGGLVPVAQIPRSNMGTPVITVNNGTTATTAWVLDAVLGNYVFTALAGRRYEARVNNMQASSTVAGDAVIFAICNGGASTPTPGSGIVANSMVSPGTNVQGMNVPLSGTFVPGAGVQTLAVALIRVAGTGTTTPLSVSGGAQRELYVVDLGPA